eukprot:scaffold23002_cov73-Skeletonema_marinoi.AAC.1
MEECAGGVEQRSNDAAVKDAPTTLSKEECAGGTGQSRNYAVMKDARIYLRLEERVLGMGQRRNYAAVKDAQIKPSKEECALGMGQRGNEYSKVVCALYMTKSKNLSRVQRGLILSNIISLIVEPHQVIEAQEGCQNQVSVSSAAYVSEIRGEEDLLAYFIAVKVKVKARAKRLSIEHYTTQT